MLNMWLNIRVLFSSFKDLKITVSNKNSSNILWGPLTYEEVKCLKTIEQSMERDTGSILLKSYYI